MGFDIRGICERSSRDLDRTIPVWTVGEALNSYCGISDKWRLLSLRGTVSFILPKSWLGTGSTKLSANWEISDFTVFNYIGALNMGFPKDRFMVHLFIYTLKFIIDEICGNYWGIKLLIVCHYSFRILQSLHYKLSIQYWMKWKKLVYIHSFNEKTDEKDLNVSCFWNHFDGWNSIFKCRTSLSWKLEMGLFI